MKADEIRQMEIPLSPVDRELFMAQLYRESTAQLAEQNEHLARLVNMLRSVITSWGEHNYVKVRS